MSNRGLRSFNKQETRNSLEKLEKLRKARDTEMNLLAKELHE